MRKNFFLPFLCTVLILFHTSETSATTYTSTTGGTHALSLTTGSATYSNITVTKTGDVSGQSDNYDWQGTNAAVHASGGGTLTITGSSTTINSSAKYGNAVFSYGGNLSGNNAGDGTTIVISDATITTTSNNSGGIMATGGGKITASDLTITTSGGSSAAIRSDKGGGTITVSGGTYTTSGTGSPAIYSTAVITGDDVTLKTNTAQVVIIEGGNSVTLTDSTLTANHNKLNGQDTTYQAILIYQSQSGDASDGTSAFKMTNGSITNTKGDIFHVTNTTCTITLSGVTITNNDSSGYFLRASSDSWGSSGSNGGKVTLTATGQTITGNILVDSVSTLAMTLTGSSTYSGAINTSGQTGTVSVSVASGSTWTLTANSYVSSLTNNGTINTGSYTLYVNGTAYTGGSSSDDDDDDDTGTAPTITTSSLSSGKVATSYSATLKASGTTPITWTLASGSLPSGLSLSSGGVISGTPTTAGSYTFTVTATNTAGSASKSYTLKITAASTTVTAPSITTTSLNDATIYASYSTTLKASGTTPITWTADSLPDGLSLTTGGALTGKATTVGTYSITFMATNSAGSDEVTLDLTVKDTYPKIRATTKVGYVGSEYSISFYSVGSGTIEWALSGDIPDGLEFTSSGNNAYITGTPTEVWSDYCTVTATNTGGTASQKIRLLIKAVKPKITTTALTAGVLSEDYEQAIAITGTDPVTVTVTGLPSGLEYDEDSMTITGTPAKWGRFNVRIRAANSGGAVTKSYRLIIYSPPQIQNITLNDATAGKTYSKRFTAKGTTSIKWSVSDGELPDGMSLVASTGLLKGKPTYDGTYTFTVQAENSYGTDTKEVSLVVKAVAPRISGTVRKGTAGKVYSSTLNATGTSPITWSIDGDLPDGITFADGVFSGTSEKYFSDKITVTATNNGGSASKTYTLTIAAIAPVIKTSSLSSGTQGEEYSATLTATGTPDITWSWTGNPSGLELDGDTGEISGTPTVYGKFSVKVTAKNDAKSVRRVYSLVIAKASNSSSLPANNTAKSPEEYTPSIMSATAYSPEEQYGNDAPGVYAERFPEEYTIVAELPEITAEESGMHDFSVVLDESATTGAKLYWIARPQDSEPSDDDEIAEFYDSDGEEISTVPDNHEITVSAWLNEGTTYKPVIAVK